MSPISSQSLNGANSASRRAKEVLKKRKNVRNFTNKIKNKLNLKVLSPEGSNLYPKLA